MNGVDSFEAVSRESLKYSPGSKSGVPKTVFLHARKIRSNSSTQFTESVLVTKEVYKDLWNLSTRPLACGW